MRKLISLFILMLIASSACAKLDYWVWVDKHGVTNYAEHEPEGVTNARHVTSTTPFGERTDTGNDSGQGSTPDDTAGNGSANAPAGASRAGGINPDAAIATQKAAIQSQIAQIKRHNCQMGKNDLAKLESYSRIRVRDKNGQERILTEKEHQQRIQQAKQIIRQNCSS